MSMALKDFTVAGAEESTLSLRGTSDLPKLGLSPSPDNGGLHSASIRRRS